MTAVPMGRHEAYSEENSLDFYPTPAPFTNVLLDFYGSRIHGSIWEPACGDGTMSKAMIARGHSVYSSDLMDHGYGVTPVDFLTTGSPKGTKSIITNGPFKLAQDFVFRAWGAMEREEVDFFAILLAAHWFGSEQRYNTIFTNRKPQQLIIISNRMIGKYKELHYNKKGKLVTHYSSNFNHCWFVWDKQADQTKTLTDWRMWKDDTVI
jgi:hypothetical protein